MSKLIDLTGKRYNRLTVIERAENAKGGVAMWKCRCDCGNICYVRGQNLKSNQVKSCGCLKRTPPNKSHNMSKTSLYRRWASIKQRCFSPECRSYKDYGGRGISMCEEWRISFDNFRDWALSNGYRDDLTIERKDNDGDYCPDNCEWIPKDKQPYNRRICYSITYNGKTQNLAEWCKEMDMDYKLVHNRIHKKGWPFERAITEPVHVEKRNRKGD